MCHIRFLSFSQRPYFYILVGFSYGLINAPCFVIIKKNICRHSTWFYHQSRGQSRPPEGAGVTFLANSDDKN